LMMPGMSGIDLLKASKSISPETETVLMTAYGTVENAVEAMKQGAYDFVTKPIKRAHLLRVLGKALEKRSLVQENRSLRAQLAAQKRRTLIGQSLPWRRTMDIVMQAAPSQATVLLLGESGTGKELLARAIHDASPRASGPFVPVNCAALPETILEAELFGYEKGAFTRAALDLLTRYEWPGNVRELENTVERAVVLCRGSAIELDDLPPDVRSGSGALSDGRSLTFAVGTPLEEIERRVIHATLAHVG